eukprot:CAMPEP_0204588336 /NCGR_PEP_ID=MMETSP0661-20131031/48566_1 /ASSEMBLY_ACC=CAM_ASM_000606 /TAXON_ID=109239 /ORGANISM="Alexandrium margalefi, Strain AMGDE01CS-322" /LENGTH=36 /DNA_ID= /DNA_START= /DNA_END= /DNA_ORIENTATION=
MHAYGLEAVPEHQAQNDQAWASGSSLPTWRHGPNST